MFPIKSQVKIAAFLVAMMLPSLAVADTNVGKISSIDVTRPMANYGFRVYLAGVANLCNSGVGGWSTSWAYLDGTEDSYKLTAAALLMAKAMGSTVTIIANLEGSYCHIYYITVN